MPSDEAAQEGPAAQADSLIRRGVALAQQGQLDDAVTLFRDALRLCPGESWANHNLGVALAEKGLHAEAAEALCAAVAARPDYVDAHYNLGNVYTQLQRPDDAMASFRRALQFKPDHPDALNNLGLALTLNGRPEEAVILLKQALRLRDPFLEATNNLGLALSEVGNFAAAADCFEQALRLDPGHVESHTNLGNNYLEAGHAEEAIACYDLALMLRLDAVSPHWNRALALLQKGDYQRGWAEYEWRRKRPNSGIRAFAEPTWDGAPLHGKTVLLHAEQGLGDVLQFVRYAPMVRARGGHVVLACPERLIPLLTRCPGIDALVDETRELPRFDYHVPLLSLPAILKTRLENVPADVPYLFADETLVAKWGQALSEIQGYGIGIVWQGNPRHRKDRHRSMPLACFEPLARVPGVRLISLQKGPGVEQLERCPFPVHALEGPLDEAAGAFSDTAAVMRSLDLVVTADTATAHLAGGLGVPTWVALTRCADWRWLRDRADSPWYPTVRLFRQARTGQWKEVFQAMSSELIARDTQTSRP